MRRLWIQLSVAFGLVVIISAVLLVGISIATTYVQAESFREQFRLAGQDVLFAEDGLIVQLKTHLDSGGTLEEAVAILENVERSNRLLAVRIGLQLVDAKGKVLYSTLDGPDPVSEVTLKDGVLRYQIRSRIPLDRPPLPNQPGPDQIIIGLAVTGLIVGIPGAILMSWRMSRPLTQLATTARQLGARNFDQRVPIRGTEEVRDVARAFNEMADALQKSEQLRNNMVADVAHELRTPLAVMESSLRALIDDVFPLTKAEILRLSDQTRHLTRLVNDLHVLALADARQLTFNMQPVDVGRIIRDIAEIFAPVAEAEGIRVDIGITPGLPQVSADEGRLKQVLQNLLVNALRHTPQEGSIALQARQDNGGVQLSIRDSGTGIAPEHIGHVFERFYRADASRDRLTGGSGLGLAIGKAIIEAHGGTISVESQITPPTGTCFTIRLPGFRS